MNMHHLTGRRPSLRPVLAAGVATLAVLALANYVAGRRAERRHPPEGRFVEVDGIRLHYTDRGTGRPVVLLHGNMVSGQDFDTSGVAEALLGSNRVIIIDRPGFGYSERPRGQEWTARQQAELFRKALAVLNVERPVIVGHSWGSLVAMELALGYPHEIAGLVLISGYYFPTMRLDSVLVAPAALPVVGDILRYTVSPLLGWLQMPGLKRILFAPSSVSARFQAEYSAGMALRPWQIRATAMDGTEMVSNVRTMVGRYGDLTMPVAIIAGHGDKIVGNDQAHRLHETVPGSMLRMVEGVGHMVHHTACSEVVAMISDVVRRSGEEIAREPARRPERLVGLGRAA